MARLKKCGKEFNLEVNMKIRIKIAIFVVAVLISLVGFNLIASPSALGMFKVGQLNGYSVDVVASPKVGPGTPAVVHINALS
jgi:hypothetical protein